MASAACQGGKSEKFQEKVSIPECCKPDFVRPAPKRQTVRSFIYATEAASPPRRGATYPESLDGPPDPLFCLAPDWVYPASLVTLGAVSSYLPISPLPRACLATRPGRFVFCDTVRHARLPRRAPAFTGNPALRCPDFPLSLATKRTPTLRNRLEDAASPIKSKQAVNSWEFNRRHGPTDWLARYYTETCGHAPG